MSELTKEELDAIRARLQAATAGPWSWLCRPGAKVISLESAKWTVMRFFRWGMQSATPAFKDKNKILRNSAEFMEVEPGREHHAEWHRVLNHPDADLIAHAPTDVARLVAEVERLRAENERLAKRAECFNERFQAACNREDDKFLEILHLQAENERLRARAVPDYSEECPTLPGWYFVRHPRPNDNPDIVGEIYRASDGLLYVEICNSSIDADDWALVQDAFMHGYRFAGPIPEPKGVEIGGGNVDQG